jgi:predicted nuclease with TOPRIM domain
MWRKGTRRMTTYEPIHTEVWEKLDEQARTLFEEKERNKQLRRANSKMKNELRSLRKENAKLRDAAQPERQHYRNGRKRGRTMNG